MWPKKGNTKENVKLVCKLGYELSEGQIKDKLCSTWHGLGKSITDFKKKERIMLVSRVVKIR